MIVSLEKPGTPKELVHHGVKGMHWGIRKEYEALGRSTTKIERKVAPKAHKAGKLTAAETKHLFDFAGRVANKVESAEQSLTPQQKKRIVYGIVGTLAVAAIVGGGVYYYKTHGGSVPGVHLSNLDKYHASVLDSITNTMHNPERAIIDRPEITIPSGNTFHRVSMSPETKFGHMTYAATNESDFSRYVASLSHVKDYHVTFQNTEPMKVASTKTVLDTLKETMSKQAGRAVTDAEVKTMYSDMAGYKWDDPTSKSFVSSLIEQGYHAIIDENDAGILAEKPLVIFNHNGLTPKRSKQMSWKTMNNFTNQVTDFANRK